MEHENTNVSGKLKTRLAPTPSGWLHAGNAFSFVLTCLVACKYGAQVLLRIDDLDRSRVRPEYLDDVFLTLDWLGIVPDEGPSGTGNFLNNYSQLHRVPLYQQVLSALANTGKVFSCACSRSQILELSADGNYSGSCLKLKRPLNQANIAWRIDTEKALAQGFHLSRKPFEVKLNDEMPYFVIKKKDGFPAYQVASLADDLHFGVNLIVRGNDLLASTGAQLYLASLLGAEPFLKARFFHHSLVKEGGQKLSKSLGATDLREIRKGSARGFYQWIGKIMGKGEKISSLAELENACSLDDIFLMAETGNLTFSRTGC